MHRYLALPLMLLATIGYRAASGNSSAPDKKDGFPALGQTNAPTQPEMWSWLRSHRSGPLATAFALQLVVIHRERPAMRLPLHAAKMPDRAQVDRRPPVPESRILVLPPPQQSAARVHRVG